MYTIIILYTYRMGSDHVVQGPCAAHLATEWRPSAGPQCWFAWRWYRRGSYWPNFWSLWKPDRDELKLWQRECWAIDHSGQFCLTIGDKIATRGATGWLLHPWVTPEISGFAITKFGVFFTKRVTWNTVPNTLWASGVPATDSTYTGTGVLTPQSGQRVTPGDRDRKFRPL